MNGTDQPSTSGWDMSRILVYGGLSFLASIMTFVFLLASYQAVTGNGPTTEVWASVTGLLGFVQGVVGTIFAFRFGTTRSSSAKDDTIRRMSGAQTRSSDIGKTPAPVPLPIVAAVELPKGKAKR